MRASARPAARPDVEGVVSVIVGRGDAVFDSGGVVGGSDGGAGLGAGVQPSAAETDDA